MSVELQCLAKGCKNDVWAITFDDTPATVLGPDRQPLVRLTPQQAAGVFQMPSGTRNFALRDGDRTVEFKISHEGAAEVRSFIGDAMLSPRPRAVVIDSDDGATRSRAIRDICLGLLLLVGGIGISVGSFLAAANSPNGGRYTILYGAPIVGFVWLMRGLGERKRPRKMDAF